MAEVDFTSSVLTALSDVFKLEIMSRVNTGDRARDNAIITLCVVIITYVCNSFLNNTFKRWYNTIYVYYISIVDKSTAPYINRLYANIGTYYRAEIDDTTNLYKILNMYKMIYDNINIFVLSDTTLKPYAKDPSKSCIELIKKKLQEESDAYNKNSNADADKKSKLVLYYKSVIYKNNNNYVFLSYNQFKKFDLELHATSHSVLIAFHKYLNSMDEIKQEVPVKNNELWIFTESSDESRPGAFSSSLLRTRNMQMYVSKHKPRILSMLDKFLSNKMVLGGYGSSNIGIMVYGEPGTGKTLLMKAIANYLNRNIRIVDMRKIKTREQFRELFLTNKGDNYDYRKLVYVFDEFDCIKGVISNRDNTDQNIELERSNEIKELKERRLQILQINTSENNKDNLKAELDKINSEISNLENALTLDTMLTVLDGVVEHTSRVIIAATNHIDKIDPALIRDGRFDIKIKLEKFNAEETRELLTIMYQNEESPIALNRLANANLVSNAYTPAQIVNLATSHDSLDSLLNLLEQPKSKKSKKKTY
jgi:DNA replication protein DnaC